MDRCDIDVEIVSKKLNNMKVVNRDGRRLISNVWVIRRNKGRSFKIKLILLNNNVPNFSTLQVMLIENLIRIEVFVLYYP